MVSNDLTQSTKFSSSFVVLAELEGPMPGHLKNENSKF